MAAPGDGDEEAHGARDEEGKPNPVDPTDDSADVAALQCGCVVFIYADHPRCSHEAGDAEGEVDVEQPAPRRRILCHGASYQWTGNHASNEGHLRDGIVPRSLSQWNDVSDDNEV